MEIQPRYPTMEVIGFLYAVGGNLPSAFAVSAGIGEKHSVALVEEDRSVSGNAFTIVCNAVQQHNGLVIEVLRTHIPALQRNRVGSIDTYLLQFSTITLSNDFRCLLPLAQGPVAKLQAGLRNHNTGQNGEQSVQACSNQQEFEPAPHTVVTLCDRHKFLVKRRKTMAAYYRKILNFKF